MRSFWLTLLILPVALSLGPIAQRFLRDDSAERVIVIDRTGGGEARSIEQRFATDRDRKTLQQLSRYVQRHKLEKADPRRRGRSTTAGTATPTSSSSGPPRIARGVARIDRVKPSDLPEFEAPPADYEMVAAPAALAGLADERVGDEAQRFFKPVDDHATPVDYVLLIPRDFGASPVVRLWAKSEARPRFVAAIQDVLTRDLRSRFLELQGVSAQAAQAASAVAPALAISAPPPGGGAREAMLVRSILPLAASYLLMMSLMLSGSWMLQGTVEERSNKLLETVLACVSPKS